MNVSSIARRYTTLLRETSVNDIEGDSAIRNSTGNLCDRFEIVRDTTRVLKGGKAALLARLEPRLAFR